jgi:hypothetical protein
MVVGFNDPRFRSLPIYDLGSLAKSGSVGEAICAPQQINIRARNDPFCVYVRSLRSLYRRGWFSMPDASSPTKHCEAFPGLYTVVVRFVHRRTASISIRAFVRCIPWNVTFAGFFSSFASTNASLQTFANVIVCVCLYFFSFVWKIDLCFLQLRYFVKIYHSCGLQQTSSSDLLVSNALESFSIAFAACESMVHFMHANAHIHKLYIQKHSRPYIHAHTHIHVLHTYNHTTMYTCTHTYMHAGLTYDDTHKHVRIDTYNHRHAYIHTHIQSQNHAFMHTYNHACIGTPIQDTKRYMHTHTCTDACIHKHTYMHVRILACTHTCTHGIHIHTCTHTHIQTGTHTYIQHTRYIHAHAA